MPASATRLLVSFARAGLKAAASRFRHHDYAHWPVRAEACERCPVRVVKCNVSYCGQPFLRQPVRDPVVDGCGCPTHAKAKDPAEHCPVNARMAAASVVSVGPGCDCKWCVATRRLAVLPSVRSTDARSAA